MTTNKPFPNTQETSCLTLPLALFLFLFAVYLLTYTPRINSSDGQAMFATAESMLRRGTLDIEQLRWMDLQQGTFGLDGLLYSRKGIGVPVGLLPLTWLGLVVPWWGAVGASLLFNAVVTALTAVVILVYLQELGFSQRIGLMVALAFGLTTLAWPYAKSLFSDPFSGLLLLGTAYTLLKFSRRAGGQGSGGAEEQGSRGEKNFTPAPLLSCPPALLLYPFIAGLLLGWNVATRYAEAIFVPVFGVLFFYYLFHTSPFGPPSDRRASRFTVHCSLFAIHYSPPLLAFSLPLLLIGLALITFNLSRYGDPFNTGYLPNETFSGLLWQGLLGQLVSPGRGLFLYCPIFLLSLVGFLTFFRRHRLEALAALSVILIHLFLYGKWFMWHGGYAWGPRFLVPTLPFWAILLAPIAERTFLGGRQPTLQPTGVSNGSAACPATNGSVEWAGGLLRLAFLTLAALGLIPQFLSLVIDFAPFQNSLLDAGLPLFAPQTFFEPQYSPFVSAWKFISANSLDLAWAWQGHINGWLLAVLVVNIGLTGFNLWLSVPVNKETRRGSNGSGGFSSYFSRTVSIICLLATLFTVTFLLIHVHSLPSGPLTEVVAALNEGARPADTVITNDPEAAQPFAELYKGRTPVLGLNSGGPPLPGEVTRRVNQTIAQHRQVWWLPGGLPPEQSAVEHLLLAQGFRARNDNFQGQRLALFAYPNNLVTHLVQEDIIFGDQITLTEAACMPLVSAGEALPIELHWQTGVKLAEDYHVFIHLVSHEGQTVAQADGQPVLWTRPTTTWAVGETIVDRHGLWIPPQTRPGDYQLQVGLYHPPDGRRLLLASGEEFIKLSITVQ